MWRHWSRLKRWLVCAGAALMLCLLLAAAGLYWFLRVPGVTLPAGVSKSTEKLTLADRTVHVDFYLPPSLDRAPVVVIAHGFTRNRRTMAGWGAMLAQEGFLVAVPDLPTWADHARNGRAVSELLAKVKAGHPAAQIKPSSPAALVGFSAGGLSTLLASAGNTNVTCWVGLDPVAFGGAATPAAKSLTIPCFVLRAEPAPWNANGLARRTFAALPGPAFALEVRHASHVDAENPTSRAADWACGQSAATRRDAFGRYLLASLRVGLLQDKAALRQLTAATNDPAVSAVEFRKPEGFQPAPTSALSPSKP